MREANEAARLEAEREEQAEPRRCRLPRSGRERHTNEDILVAYARLDPAGYSLPAICPTAIAGQCGWQDVPERPQLEEGATKDLVSRGSQALAAAVRATIGHLVFDVRIGQRVRARVETWATTDSTLP